MSFTTNIKNEILNIDYPRAELISELSAIINIGADLEKNNFSLYLENIGVSRRIYKLFKDLFNAEIELKKEKINRLNKNYLIHINIKDENKKILKTLNIVNDGGQRKRKPDDYMTDNIEEKKAYLRGAFLICGSVNDPSTSRYHLEFIIDNKTTADFINKLLNELNYNSKVLKREKHYMVYLKESERISDFITHYSTMRTLEYIETIKT